MNPRQVGRAGELFVAAEIHRRGGYAVTFAGNMPGIDILASDLADRRRISIQVPLYAAYTSMELSTRGSSPSASSVTLPTLSSQRVTWGHDCRRAQPRDPADADQGGLAGPECRVTAGCVPQLR
jgi:hypothetical protein